MSRITFDLTGIEVFANMEKAAVKAANDGMQDVMLDLKRVSEGLTPIKTGKLTGSCMVRPYKYKGVQSYELSYAAVNKSNQNYAIPMHYNTYNLGDASLRRVPPKSAYSDKTFKVGPGYLVNTANALKDDYTKHLREMIVKKMKK